MKLKISKKLLIIIIAAVVVLAGAGIGSYFLFFSGEREPKEKPAIREYYVPGEFFVTNVKDSRYLLKTTIVLEISETDMAEYLTKNNHIIRDVIVFTLREMTEEELRETGVQNDLRRKLVDRLNEELEVEYITTIYFNDFVLQ